MFLRIEGFQVEIKEINKSWDQAIFLKNFKLGKKILIIQEHPFCNILSLDIFIS